MIRSQRPGRLLRLGRGPCTPRPLVSSYPSLSCVHARYASTNKRRLTLEEYKLVCNYTDLADSPISLKNRNPDAWIPFLVSCLKPPQQTQQSATPTGSTKTLFQHVDDLNRGHALMSYLWLAKSFRGMNLLAHMGFELGQWSTVNTLLSELIDTYEILAPYTKLKNAAADLEWSLKGSNMTLDDISYERLSAAQIANIKMPASHLDLNVTTRRPAVESFADRLLGSVLLHLGSLVLAAADRSPSDRKLAMSCVFRTLARLHHLGLISDNVYQYHPADPDQITFRPPGLNLLSSHIMTVLSDAAWLEHESSLANSATEAGEEPPFLPFNVGFRELGPEIWLELILWCCVEHGFSKQGALLLRDMATRNDDHAWKVASWEPLVRALDVVRQTDISTEESWRDPESDKPPVIYKGRERPPFNGLGRRTISTQVVASLRDMLYNKSFVSVGTTGMSAEELLTLSASAQNLLESDTKKTKGEPRLTNRSTNWNFNRMLNSGGFLPENDPIAFAKLLRSTQNVVPPWGGEPIPTDERLNEITRAQIYDETAAMSGLIQQSIRLSARKKQAGAAFSGYEWLQKVVDASKSYHIRAFLEKFNQYESPNTAFFQSRQPDPSMAQSSLPQIQNVVMADLLDLITACRAFDFGNWLLFNDDIDGPAISQSSYGDQAIAPSILRFAAATQNKELSDRVVSSLGTPLTTNTLKAVINLHISVESWDRALLTFNYLRDYRAKSWGFSNITTLAAKIITLDASIQRKLASGLQSPKKDQESLAKAIDIFTRLFRGEFSTSPSQSERVSDFQRIVLRRLWPFFEVVPGPIYNILKNAGIGKSLSRDKTFQIPPNSFQSLLSAVVDNYGSKAGKRLFDEWCLNTPTPDQLRTKSGGVIRLPMATERKHYETSGDRNFNATWHEHAQSKLVIPDLNTYRILAQAAYREYELERAQTQATQTRQKMSSVLPSSSTRASPLVSPRSFLKSSHQNQAQAPIHKSESSQSVIPPATDAEALLDFCVGKFLQENMEEWAIELEIPGYLALMRFRGALSNESFSPPSHVKQAQDKSWMQSLLARKNKVSKVHRNTRNPGEPNNTSQNEFQGETSTKF
ncbi:uncharacterized protein N7469_004805 [Penicillium citrinum]|uniref:Uncharacterized protein n=1 Tax=Penicillium citrinum TaxID=5077 RepID=A0A9W9P5D6_PENCI|nr:uncharacterized protein N7469_004805 [Penicillium citrinum]KAJ5235637.1 hypothetical protein N7469_004805 [Penicillium citrinum]